MHLSIVPTGFAHRIAHRVKGSWQKHLYKYLTFEYKNLLLKHI